MTWQDRWESEDGLVADVKAPPSKAVTASATLMQAACTDGQFCMETHKPGLCKGQKRGESEPGQPDATKATPVQKAQIAVKGLGQAIAQAQTVAQTNITANPKLAAMARKAVADYRKALRPHQQTLRKAAAANIKAQRTGIQDARQQDAIDKRAAKQRDSLGKRAQAILDRRAQQAKLAKMSKKERAAYHRQQAAKAAAQRTAQENKIINQAKAGK